MKITNEFIENFTKYLESITNPVTGEITDPYSHRYKEGYSPAIASNINNYLYSITQKEKYKIFYFKYLKRSLYLLTHSIKDNNNFTDLFIAYFLMKNLTISDLGKNYIRENFFLIKNLNLSYKNNLNGHIMTLALEFQLSHENIDELKTNYFLQELEEIKKYQSKNGLFRDDKATTQTPLAYHLLCFYFLAEWLNFIENNCKSNLQIKSIEDYILKLIEKENFAILNFYDGNESLALSGRSRDTFWSYCTFCYYLKFQNFNDWEKQVTRIIDKWKKFVKKDYSISNVANYFPHEFNQGYESYVIGSMYNTLGYCILSTMNLRQPKFELKDVSKYLNRFFHDEETGYLSIRNNGKYIAMVTKNSDTQNYLSDSSIFYMKFTNRSNNIFANSNQLDTNSPLISTDNFEVIKSNKSIFPKIQNYKLHFINGKITLEWEQDFAKITKVITLSDRLIIEYIFQIKHDIDCIKLNLPIVIFDGHDFAELKSNHNKYSYKFEKRNLIIVSQRDIIASMMTYTTASNGHYKVLSTQENKISANSKHSFLWIIETNENHSSQTFPNFLDDNWNKIYGNNDNLETSANKLKFDFSYNEKIYFVSGGKIQNWNTLPEKTLPLENNSNYFIEFDCNLSKIEKVNYPVVFIITYENKNINSKISRKLSGGKTIIPLTTFDNFTGFRIAFRLSGKGEVVFNYIKLTKLT